MNGDITYNSKVSDAIAAYKPADLNGLHTYDLASRPSKVFHDDLGKPAEPGVRFQQWFDSLPRQLAGNDIRRVADHLTRAYHDGSVTAVGIGGHVIKTGCGPYLVDWINKGVIKSLSMNGAAAIHDFELAYAGKTSENVSKQLPTGQFGMVRETADAFAVASRNGAENGLGLGWALGGYMEGLNCPFADSSVVLAAFRAGIPCTVHVAIGTDIVHMHSHVSGAAVGEASMTDFRRLCTVVSQMKNGIWFNMGSAVFLPEVFVKAVAAVNNLGHDLQGLVTINLDKQWQYRPTVNVVERPAEEGIQLTGHHELILPLLNAVVNERLASQSTHETARAA